MKFAEYFSYVNEKAEENTLCLVKAFEKDRRKKDKKFRTSYPKVLTEINDFMED